MGHFGFIISFSVFLCSFCSGSELELFNDLFAKYNNKVRPVRNASTVIHVGVQLQILSLLEVGNGVHGSAEVKAHVVGGLTELRQSMAQLTEAMMPVRKYLENVEEDASRNEQWGLIFDRIDMIFFVGFQIINAFTLVLVYVKSL